MGGARAPCCRGGLRSFPLPARLLSSSQVKGCPLDFSSWPTNGPHYSWANGGMQVEELGEGSAQIPLQGLMRLLCLRPQTRHVIFIEEE